MREILFRGKRKDNGEWVYGYYVRTAWYLELEGYMDIIIPIDSILYSHCEINEYFEIIPETVGQFTGLVDKNDVRIFEGDIVTIGGYGSGVVNHDIRGCYCSNKNIGPYWGHYLEDNPTYYEVIGNVYDNPELLEKVVLENE